jgi:Icc protein
MLIAQISDFHLKGKGELAYAVADTAAPLERAVAHVNSLQPASDVVLITGDLVDDGAPGSYALLRELLAPLRAPFFLVPGNHDQKARLRRTFQQQEFLYHTLESDGVEYLCYTVEEFPVRLIGLDTVTPGEHGGGLDGERLSWLAKALADRPDVPTILFMHHPPFASAIGHMDKEVFRGRRELETLVARHPQIERILCGHLHRTIFRRFAGTIASACPGIGMQLCLDLREDAPSAFVLEPPAAMLHVWTSLWGDPALLSHVSLIEDTPGQYSGPHPFFDVASPE